MHTINVITPGITIKDGKSNITVWAPNAERVYCRTYDPDKEIALIKQAYGYWNICSEMIGSGQEYHFVVDGKVLPDPASRSQPHGVHGRSAVVDLHFEWTDQHYRCPALREFIIYELHVGTFSPTHDFEGVIARLPYLRDLGITAIEIMPVAQFPGERNWGYDGTFLFAVQHSYGGAEGLQRLVNACHQNGIAVILDVVYNHFGPEGNYLEEYGPYLTDKYKTPWGKAVNYDDAWNNGVRDFICENVRMWLRDFHIDALRLDAVHAIKDFSPVHILQDIRRTVNELMQESGKVHYVIAECDLNDRRFLESLQKNGFALDAQWVDEFHHTLRVAAGEEKKGYYTEFNGVKHLAKAYRDAYVYTGEFSSHRQKFFGSHTEGIPAERFVIFSQNHDQVGNRMLGERSSKLYSPSLQRLLAMAVITSPFVPLIFMGEEWASQKPFLYFISHSDATLIAAVRKGRREEFAYADTASVPDPQNIETFRRSVLDWEERTLLPQTSMHLYYKALIQLRKTDIIPQQIDREAIQVTYSEERETLRIVYPYTERALVCLFNFSSSPQVFQVEEDGDWQKVMDSADPLWGGTGATVYHPDDGALIIPAQSGCLFHITEL